MRSFKRSEALLLRGYVLFFARRHTSVPFVDGNFAVQLFQRFTIVKSFSDRSATQALSKQIIVGATPKQLCIMLRLEDVLILATGWTSVLLPHRVFSVVLKKALFFQQRKSAKLCVSYKSRINTYIHISSDNPQGHLYQLSAGQKFKKRLFSPFAVPDNKVVQLNANSAPDAGRLFPFFPTVGCCLCVSHAYGLF